MTTIWHTAHQAKPVHPPLVQAMALHHLATTLHQDSKVLLLLALEGHLQPRPLSRLALMEEEWKNKVSQRECQERCAEHQVLSKYSMVRAEMWWLALRPLGLQLAAHSHRLQKRTREDMRIIRGGLRKQNRNMEILRGKALSLEI